MEENASNLENVLSNNIFCTNSYGNAHKFLQESFFALIIIMIIYLCVAIQNFPNMDLTINQRVISVLPFHCGYLCAFKQ